MVLNAARNNTREDIDIWSPAYGAWQTHKLDQATYHVDDSTFVVIIRIQRARICFGLGQQLLSLYYVRSGQNETFAGEREQGPSGQGGLEDRKAHFRLVIWARVSNV